MPISRALESVREHITRLVEETRINRDLADTELDRRLGQIRDAEADTSRRAQLEEMNGRASGGCCPIGALPELGGRWRSATNGR